jgi:hypothetical protein
MNQITLEGIDETLLEPLTKLGQGGQAVVYATAYRLPDVPWQLAYKQFKPRMFVDDLSVLGNLIDRHRLLMAEESHLSSGAWPLQLVTKLGRVAGFLMRTAPDDFFFDQKLPRAQSKRRLLELQHLLNPPEQLLRYGLTVSDQWRLEFLRDLAKSMAELHVRRIAVGDLSPKNLLASFTADPRCFLLDCDAVTVKARSLFPQSETAEWECPDLEKGTSSTDAFKLALLAVRLFACDQFTRDPHALHRVGPGLVALATRGLSLPEMRPPPGDWLDALSRAVPLASTMPLPASPTTSSTKQHSPAAASPATGGTWARTQPGASGTGTTMYPQPATGASGSWSPSPKKRGRLVVGALSLLAGVAVYLNPAALQPVIGPVHDQVSSWLGQAQQSVQDYQASHQADALNELLKTSADDRASVAAAVKAVADCDSGSMNQWLAQLASGTSSRHRSVTEAQAVDVDLLQSGNELKKALVKSLELSAAADDAYLKWAGNRAKKNCSKKSKTTQDLNKALAKSRAAGKYKSDVGRLWKPIAVRYSLPAYGRKSL